MECWFFGRRKNREPGEKHSEHGKNNNRNNPHKAPEGIARVPVLICEIQKAMDGKLEFNASHYSWFLSLNDKHPLMNKPPFQISMSTIFGGRNSLEHVFLATFPNNFRHAVTGSAERTRGWASSRWRTNTMLLSLSLSSLKVNFFLRTRGCSITSLRSK